MSHYRVYPSTLQGEITIPPSKSHTLRAILFASMAEGKSTIYNYLDSTDTRAMVQACQHFGASIHAFPDRIEIEGVSGKISHAEDVIQSGNSGIVFRFCTALGALASHPVVITGDYSIRHYRPILPLLAGLSQLGVTTSTLRGDNHAPVIVQGPIQPGKTHISSEDAQHASALIIASCFAQGPVEIHVSNAGEKPWVDLTLSWLDKLDIPYQRQGHEYYRLSGNARYPGFEYIVPGDFSTAAFPLVAALITQSELTLRNLDMQDAQGDKQLIFQLQKMGANITYDAAHRTLQVKKGPSLKGMDIDINDFVDAITILAVVACFAEGETRIYNAEVVKHKECNRIACITSELQKMGADITATEDGLLIRKSILKANALNSFHDHRMALSLAVAAMTTDSPSTISPIECVSKTFPDFVKSFNALGANIEVHP